MRVAGSAAVGNHVSRPTAYFPTHRIWNGLELPLTYRKAGVTVQCQLANPRVPVHAQDRRQRTPHAGDQSG
jgi:hypothetical protein